MLNFFFPRKSSRLWDNVERSGSVRQTKHENIIRRMRIACWITKATDTDSEYVLLIGFPRQQWLRERVCSVRWYVHCLSGLTLKRPVATPLPDWTYKFLHSVATVLFRRFHKLVKSAVSFSMTFRPHGTTRLTLDGCLWSLIFEYFSKTCRQHSSLIKAWKEWRVLYMRTYVCVW